MVVLNTTEYETCKRNLLQIANIISPTATEQQSFSTMINKMEAVGESYELVVNQLLSSIEDGLMYGNWPKP